MWNLFFFLYEKNIKSNVFYLILAGLFTGIALLFRHQAGMQIIFLSFYFIIYYLIFNFTNLKTYLIRVNHLLFFILSFCFPTAIVIYIFYFMGVLDHFYFWVLEFNFKYIKAGVKILDLYIGVVRLSLFIIFTFPMWFLLIKIIYKDLFKRPFSFKLGSFHRSLLFLILWLIFSFYPVFIGNRFYSHYFIQVFPALCFLSAFSAMKYYNFFLLRKLFIIVLVYAIIFFIPRINHDFTKKIIAKIIPKAAKLGVYPEQKLVGQYIKKNTNPSDYIFVWGFATPIYVYANRSCGSKFSWTDFLSGRIPGKALWDESIINSNFYILSKSWNQFCKDMNNYQPVYFVNTASGSYHEYENYPIDKIYYKFNLKKFIDSFYKKEITIKKIELYKKIKSIKLNCNF